MLNSCNANFIHLRNEDVLETRDEAIRKHLGALLSRINNYLNSDDRSDGPLLGLLTSSQALIERYAPPNSPYIRNCNEVIESDGHELWKIDRVKGIVEGLREDYKAGGLAPIRDLIRGEVFEDFLDMAEHLLESGYKDSAAVIVGGVLEQQLKKLCNKHEIPIQVENKLKKSEALNADLASNGVYGKLDQKNVTSWLDLRNKAAHAEYNSYSFDQVEIILIGVKDFVRRLGA